MKKIGPGGPPLGLQNLIIEGLIIGKALFIDSFFVC
jgi:hypothetical protein